MLGHTNLKITTANYYHLYHSTALNKHNFIQAYCDWSLLSLSHLWSWLAEICIALVRLAFCMCITVSAFCTTFINPTCKQRIKHDQYLLLLSRMEKEMCISQFIQSKSRMQHSVLVNNKNIVQKICKNFEWWYHVLQIKKN